MQTILVLAALLAAPGADGVESVVVTATRAPSPELETPATTKTVDREQVERRSYRTLPQILRDVAGVMVQETSAGQGSPYLRGFTGFHNVMLIDGIRLNNSVFRPGPNQYWNTVDPLSVERLEVVFGPASVLYGSDAVGGAVQAFTFDPLAYGGESRLAGRLFYRFASAENSHMGRAEMRGLVDEVTAALAGFSAKSFDDLEAGGDVGTQTNVGYDEWDADVKIARELNDRLTLVAGYQQVELNNVPRTHKTTASRSFHSTTIGSEIRRDLDQERWLAYVQLHALEPGGAIDAWHASVSWHSQSEVRDRIRSGNRRDKQGFDVGTLGVWFQLESPTSIGRLTYGLDWYRDFVDSFSSRNAIQGPVADEATYDLLGVFVNDVAELGERWQLTLGVRFTWAAADADSVSDPETGGRISIHDDWTALVGSARVLYRLVPDAWSVFAGISQGFRAPNLSDLTRLDSARSNEFEIPAPGLDPEFFTTIETGIKGGRGNHSVRFSVFFTDIRDLIVRFPTGATNIDGESVVTKDNVGDGWIWGLELRGSWRFASEWTVFGSVAYQEGKADTFPTSDPVTVREYLDRLMPLTAQVGVRWEQSEGRFWGELQVVMAAKADRLSTRDRNDTDRIPPGGTPGYGVAHLRGGWRIREGVDLTLALENLFDKAYRVHGSGVTMPGRSAVVSVSFDF